MSEYNPTNRSLSEYHLFGEVDLEQAGKVHTLAQRFRRELLEDHDVQDLLLNRGYDIPKANRPNSFHDIGVTTWNRRKVSSHIRYLEFVMDLAIKPGLVTVEKESIVDLLGQEPIEHVKTSGFDAEYVEKLQRGWLENHEERETVRKFQKCLHQSFDEYNMQMVLGLMPITLGHFFPPTEGFYAVLKLQGEVKAAFGENLKSTYPFLDNAYYNMAQRYFRSAEPIWTKLSETGFGKSFILMPDEVEQSVRENLYDSKMRRFDDESEE